MSTQKEQCEVALDKSSLVQEPTEKVNTQDLNGSCYVDMPVGAPRSASKDEINQTNYTEDTPPPGVNFGKV